MQLSNTFKHYEVVKYLYFTNAGGAMGGEFMNQKVFNRFPKETQEMFLKLREEFGERFAKGIQDQENEIYKTWNEKHRITLKEASAEDRKLIAAAGQSSTEFIIKKAESDGHKGAGKVWEYYQKSLDKYEKGRTKMDGRK
jgi:TRAP-type C4-dicarboxylate transport system substrate-binding protein